MGMFYDNFYTYLTFFIIQRVVHSHNYVMWGRLDVEKWGVCVGGVLLCVCVCGGVNIMQLFICMSVLEM